MRTHIISIALQKGGVGKSTTAQNLSAYLGSKGKKVLLIDLDAQCNATFSSGAEPKEQTASDFLGGQCSPEDAIVSCNHYDIIPADSYLSNVESAEVDKGLLKHRISPCIGKYDFIFIDTPPALNNLLKNALYASDYVIIPMDAKPYAVQGLDTFTETMKEVNPDLRILGIVLVRYNDRSIINKSMRNNIREYAKELNTLMFNTYIREGVAVPESQATRQDLIDYAPKSNPASDYERLAGEFLKKMRQ